MLNLKILTRMSTIFDGEITSVLVPGAAGQMEILAGHMPIISTLETGIIRIKADGEAYYFTISRGILSLVNNDVTIFSDASESPAEIDADRSIAARERAEKRVDQFKDKPTSHEYKRAYYSMKRAENRLVLLEVSKKKN